MSKSNKKETSKRKGNPAGFDEGLPQIRANAAGIDIGASEIWVDVGHKDAEPVRRFETFTENLNHMADWLKQCGIETVAMESTGVYWIPVCQILESHGIEVVLVNARHVKNVSGRKTDMLDCQWLRILQLGAYCRRMCSRLGPAKAIVATAHKLALLVYRMLKFGRNYVDIGQEKYEEQYKERTLQHLGRKALELGFQLVAVPSN